MIHSLHAALLLVAWYACTNQVVVTPTLLFHVVPFVIHVFVELPPPIFFQLNYAPNLPSVRVPQAVTTLALFAGAALNVVPSKH